mgnify:FL=1
MVEDLLWGAQVIVEDVEAARREAGDVALGSARRVVFKTVGMPWEDLAVARVVAGVSCRVARISANFISR